MTGALKILVYRRIIKTNLWTRGKVILGWWMVVVITINIFYRRCCSLFAIVLKQLMEQFPYRQRRGFFMPINIHGRDGFYRNICRLVGTAPQPEEFYIVGYNSRGC